MTEERIKLTTKEKFIKIARAIIVTAVGTLILYITYTMVKT
jgi:hypothetical protein